MRTYSIILLLVWILSRSVPSYGSAEPFIGDIQCFAFNFCPTGWLECNGQVLSIASNTALFSLLGINYGGDGRTNFALPNLLGKHLVQAGIGAGLTPRGQGQTGGSDYHTLTPTEMPSHTHTISAYHREADQTVAGGNVWGKSADGSLTYSNAAPTVTLRPDAVAPSGSGTPLSVDIRQPSLSMKCCIATQGVFPPR
jgi:microcystin-dependent protein